MTTLTNETYAIETTGVPSERKPKGRFRRILRRVLRGTLALLMILVVAATVAHFAWKYSGSNQWEKSTERHGVTLYTKKVPGETIYKFKAVWKVRTRLSQFVMWVNDTNSTAMRKNTGLNDLKILEYTDRRSVSAYKQPFGDPLKMRQFVIQTEISQDPKTQAILYTVRGVPDRIPPDDCCVRIPVMDNYWKLTPLKGGEVEVEWFCDMALGGAVPYAMQNKVMPQGMLNFAKRVGGFVNRPKYKDARYDWIQDGGQS